MIPLEREGVMPVSLTETLLLLTFLVHLIGLVIQIAKK